MDTYGQGYTPEVTRLQRIKLEAVLAEEAEACAQMGEHLAAQRRAILERNPQGLQEASEALATAGEGLRRAARWRGDLPREPGGGPHQGELARLRRVVQQGLADVQREAALNQELLHDALAYMQVTWRAMTAPDATYGRQGATARDGMVLVKAG